MFLNRCLGTDEQGALTIGGLSVGQIANDFGTPVYIMDQETIEENCRTFTNALETYYDGNGAIAFASKALSITALYAILKEQGLWCDVVSGGELFTAIKAGFDPAHMIFHGNSKTKTELDFALSVGVGRIVVDNIDELMLLNEIAGNINTKADICFRLKPGVDAHTHDFIATGRIDSKFGVAIETGEALAIVKTALSLPNVNVCGVHCHIGSQIFGVEPFAYTVDVMLRFMAECRDVLGIVLQELNLGGGFGVRYIEADDPRPLADCIKASAQAVRQAVAQYDFPLPKLFFEPGRSLVAEAGITVYQVMSIKEIPNIRNYALVDGGMGDNPRRIMYDANYTVLPVARPLAKADTQYTVAGRCCESGDIVAECAMPALKVGELVCVLSTGAYNYSMANNYNRVPRPPIVFVKDGKAQLAVRRETYDDVTACDVAQ